MVTVGHHALFYIYVKFPSYGVPVSQLVKHVFCVQRPCPHCGSPGFEFDLWPQSNLNYEPSKIPCTSYLHIMTVLS